MKKITINKKEYTFEYSIEASLYNECTKSVMDMFIKGGFIQGEAEQGDTDGAMNNIIQSIADIPERALTLFYAGLLEHHGSEGDGSVLSKSDAKKILADFLKEKKKSFRDVLGEMIELMVKDNFFDLIGLTEIAKETEKELENEIPSKDAGKNTSEK